MGHHLDFYSTVAFMHCRGLTVILRLHIHRLRAAGGLLHDQLSPPTRGKLCEDLPEILCYSLQHEQWSSVNPSDETSLVILLSSSNCANHQPITKSLKH